MLTSNLVNGERGFHFHGDVAWKRGHTDCRPRMAALFAKDIIQKIRGAVDDSRVVSEARICIDEPKQFYHRRNGIEIETCGIENCKENKSCIACVNVRCVNGLVRLNLLEAGRGQV